MSSQHRHPLLNKMNKARRFRLSGDADERILDSLRQAEEFAADEDLFDRARSRSRSAWPKWRTNWRPAAAACLAVVILGGAIGVGYANGGFGGARMSNGQAKDATHGPMLSAATSSASAARVISKQGPPMNSGHSGQTSYGTLVTGQYPHAVTTPAGLQQVHVKDVHATNLPTNMTPTNAYLASETFTLSNGDIATLSTNSLLWAVSLDQHSVVAAIIPGTYPPEYTVGLLGESNGQWSILTEATAEPSAVGSKQSTSGLTLPKNTLIEAAPFNFYDNKQGEAWVCYTSGGIGVIAKYQTISFAPPKGAEHFKVGLKNAWLVSAQNGQDSLAYVKDGSSIVAVGGDLTSAQSEALLRSLPPVTNANFPFWN